MISQSGGDSPSVTWLPVSITIDAPVEQVWAMLTDESKLPHWFAGYPLLSYPGEGTRRSNPTGQTFILSFPKLGPPREVHGEYVSFSPPDRLVMRFREEEKTSLVTYALRPEGPRTTLVVTSEAQYHSGALQSFGRVHGPLSDWFYHWVARSSLRRFRRLVERG